MRALSRAADGVPPRGLAPRRDHATCVSMRQRIDFLVCGAQKAGTTALHSYLSEVPGVGLADEKEVHFFDDEGHDWSSPDYEGYHRRFRWDDGASVRGEATPIYLYWPNCLERIAAYNPDMRLIVLLRDPVMRAWSHWRMERARGAETEPFSWCIRAGRHRLFDQAPWGFHREFSYVERGFYSEQLQRLFELFPRQQVLVLGNDDLHDRPAATMHSVCDFLGVPRTSGFETRSVHVGRDVGPPPQLPQEDADYLRMVFNSDVKRIEALAGRPFAWSAAGAT